MKNAPACGGWGVAKDFSKHAKQLCDCVVRKLPGCISVITKQEAVVDDEVSVRRSVSESIAFRDAIVGDEFIERESFSSVTSGTEVRSSGSFSHDADSLVFAAALDLSMNSAGQLGIDGSIIEIGV